jgi:NAD(P)-dependent dehydrogenase (short-subunit alcohol dehydrogenase family)
MGRMEGRTAVVTGAASGIGRTTALLFAAEGAAVACVDRDADTVAALADEIAGAGGRAVGVGADVTSATDMEQAAAVALEAFGAIDTMFANAGITGVGSAHELAVADWQRVIDVNLTGVWLSARAVLPSMIERGRGSIVTTASVGGLVGVRAMPAYSAAKAGVIGLTRQLAVDYADRGVRANAICPGTTWTPLVEETYREGVGVGFSPGAAPATMEERKAASAARYPLGRLGRPEDVAAYALFLASDETAWTTGGVFVVDGGFTAL